MTATVFECVDLDQATASTQLGEDFHVSFHAVDMHETAHGLFATVQLPGDDGQGGWLLSRRFFPWPAVKAVTIERVRTLTPSERDYLEAF
jgi:hypothetical protein